MVMKLLIELRGAFRIESGRKMFYLGEGPQLYPRIEYENCTFCDLCARSCMYGAIKFADKKYIFEQSRCVSCGLCTTVCPSAALVLEESA